MAGNFSGSWMMALTANRLAEMAGLAIDGAWPMPINRDARTFEAAIDRTATASARAIRVIADDDDQTIVPQPTGFGSPQILSDDLFRSALIRERKRADRFEEVFALLTIEGAQAVGIPSVLQSIAAAIGLSTRDTDLVGWLDDGATLAVLLPELVSPAQDAAAGIEARIVKQLGSRLGTKTIAQLRVRLHVHAGLGAGDSSEALGRDPLVEEIRSAKQGATLRESLKRALDIAVSLTLLILLSPVFLILAALVKLTSPGPVLFEQSRIGEMAKPFKMLKFRSMHAKAPSELHQQFVTDFIKSRGQAAGGDKSFFKIARDPRITSIGHILRKTSLDELPQLWNVLRGDMSLVGPRPPLQYELDQYRSWHWRRVLEAKPGMTGLWQVEGRSRTTFDEMVRLDLRYVRKRSFWTDIRILVATPRAVITGKGAF